MMGQLNDAISHLNTVHQLALGVIIGADNEYQIVRICFCHNFCFIMDITVILSVIASKDL